MPLHHRPLLYVVFLMVFAMCGSSRALAAEYLLENRFSGKIMEVHPDEVSRQFAWVHQVDNREGPNQRWLISPVDEDSEFYVIENRASGMVIAARDGENGTAVFQVRYQARTQEQWKLVEVTEDYVYIENRRNGKRLEIDQNEARRNVPVRQMENRDETVQQWRFITVE